MVKNNVNKKRKINKNPYVCERCGNPINKYQKKCPYCKLDRKRMRYERS